MTKQEALTFMKLGGTLKTTFEIISEVAAKNNSGIRTKEEFKSRYPDFADGESFSVTFVEDMFQITSDEKPEMTHGEKTFVMDTESYESTAALLLIGVTDE